MQNGGCDVDVNAPTSGVCKYFVPACTSLLDSCLDKDSTNVQVIASIQNVIKVVRDICSGEEISSVVLMTAASRVLPLLMRQVASDYNQTARKHVVHAVQRLAWKLEAGLLTHSDQVVNVHGLIFSDGRNEALSWAMLPPPPASLPLTKCFNDRRKASNPDVSPNPKLQSPRKSYSLDFLAAVSSESLKSLLSEDEVVADDRNETRRPNGNVDWVLGLDAALPTPKSHKFEVGSTASDPGCLKQSSVMDDVFSTECSELQQVVLRRRPARATSTPDGCQHITSDKFHWKLKNSLQRQSSLVTMNQLHGDVTAEFLTSGSNVNEILERRAFQGKLPAPDMLDEFKMLNGRRKHYKSESKANSRFYTETPIVEESSEQSELSNPSTPVKLELASLCYSDCPAPTPSAADDCVDSSPVSGRRRSSRLKSLSVRLSKFARMRLNFGRQESLDSNRSSASSMENLLECNDKFAYVSVNSTRKKTVLKQPSVADSPTPHRWFEINLKTNLDEYDLKFCRVYKRFRDLLDVYDAIAEAHGTAHLPPKMSRNVVSSSSSVAGQIERLLNAILSMSELRTCRELVDFFRPEDDGDSGDIDRQLLASFFTPYGFSSKDSSNHWPKTIALPGPARSPEATRKVMKRMLVRNPTLRSAEESNMDRHLCIVIREDCKEVMILVWDDETDTHVVAAGTIEHLVEHLANEDRPDPGYVKTFLMGYRHFMKADDLIHRLLARFNINLPEESTDEEKEYVEKWGLVVQLRTVDVLTQWMERCWFDFHDQQFMLDRVDLFIEELGGSDNGVFMSLAGSLKKVKDKKIEEETKRMEAAKLVKPEERSQLSFDGLTALQLAKQLTLTELAYLKAIEPTEFIRQLWDKHPGSRAEKKRALSPNICEYVDHFNRVCFWVGTQILSYHDVRMRAACVEKMTEIAKLCRSYNNFNTSMAVVTGLNYSAVSSRRLKLTWEHVSLKAQATLEELEDVFTSESNFITYRRLQGSLKRSAPCIPFFGLYSKDFVFINDGNPKYLANGLVNFSKLRMVMHRVSDLEWYQHSKFNFASEANSDHLLYCRTLQAMDDEKLYELSLLVEPKVQVVPSSD